MITSTTILWVVVLALAEGGLASGGHPPSRLQVRIEMAQIAIVTAAMNAASPAGRYSCSEGSYSCAGPDKAELGLAILESDQSGLATSALVELMAVNLDGGFSSDYSCTLSARRNKVRKALDQADAEVLRSRCLVRVESIQRRSRPLYDDVEVEKTCLGLSRIQSRLKEARVLLAQETSCDDV